MFWVIIRISICTISSIYVLLLHICIQGTHITYIYIDLVLLINRLFLCLLYNRFENMFSESSVIFFNLWFVALLSKWLWTRALTRNSITAL